MTPGAFGRRRFLEGTVTAVAALPFGMSRSAHGQSRTGAAGQASFGTLKRIEAGVLTVAYAEAGPPGGPVVILLHGWPYDIHSFVEVTPRLASAGYRVIVPHLRGYGTTRFLSSGTFRNGQPSAMAADVIALMDASPRSPTTSLRLGARWAQQDGPVILVGHSWAGVFITEAGMDPKVAGLVYVAAFGPDQGDAVGELGKAYPPPAALAAPIVDGQGFMSLPTEAVVKLFASDLPASEARILAAIQGPIAASASEARVSSAAWKTKPSWYIVSKLDTAIAPEEERFFAKRMKATTTELSASHVPMLSQPKAVATVIMDAAAESPGVSR